MQTELIADHLPVGLMFVVPWLLVFSHWRWPPIVSMLLSTCTTLILAYSECEPFGIAAYFAEVAWLWQDKSLPCHLHHVALSSRTASFQFPQGEGRQTDWWVGWERQVPPSRHVAGPPLSLPPAPPAEQRNMAPLAAATPPFRTENHPPPPRGAFCLKGANAVHFLAPHCSRIFLLV